MSKKEITVKENLIKTLSFLWVHLFRRRKLRSYPMKNNFSEGIPVDILNYHLDIQHKEEGQCFLYYQQVTSPEGN